MEISSYLKKAAEDIKKAASSIAEKVENTHNKYKTESELDELYKTLGEIRYEELTNNEDATEESHKLSEEITRLKAKLDEYSNASQGERICPWCNENVPKDAAFCPFCGYKF